MLAVALLAGLVMEGWGQTSLPTINDVGDALVRHTTTETLYVVEGQDGTLELQESGNVQDNIDGYIRWYTLKNEQAGKTGLIRAGTSIDETVLTEYENGYAWTSTGTVMPTQQVNTIIYNFTQEQINAGISIVCDASSVRGIIGNDGNLTPRVVSIRHIYNVVDAAAAGSRNDEMEGKKSSFAKLNIADGRSDISPLLSSLNPEDYLLYEYEIHTPIPERTALATGGYYTDYSNFRLPERVTNYFVKVGNDIVAANGVRWTFYDSDGKKLDGDFQIITNESRVNLSLYQDGLSQTEKHTRYVLVEVANGTGSGSKFKPSSDWYPVSLLNVTLEPYAKALTAEKLKEKENDPNYEDRLVALELDPVHYKQIASISFEEEGDILWNPEATLINNKELNFKDFSLGPFTEGSYYAYAEPQLAPHKEQNRITATRGEYVLYRTLGYPGISRYKTDKITIDGASCQYIDFFMSTNGRYQVKVTDRLWEKTGGEQSGYFMFLDATDEAGVITKIAIKDQLCENTSLIVSAWICDLSFDVRNPDVVQGDVALTFKKRNKDGDETILSKFYTGELIRQPEYGNEYTTSAQWQQVSFKFTINEALGDDEEYLVEIANNSRGSSGADYGIDDIQVFKTLPNITVQREDACDASTLTVSSNYETLLRNMGYTSGEPTVAAGENFKDQPELIQYRLGLYGADPTNMFQEDSYIFNTYFSFVEGIDDDRPDAIGKDITKTDESDLKAENPTPIILGPQDEENDDNKDVYRWVRINKGVSTHGKEVVFAYRSIITTRASDLKNYPTDSVTAGKWEKVYNLRAVNDFNYLFDEWNEIYSTKPGWLEYKQKVSLANLPDDLQAYLDFDKNVITDLDLPLSPASEQKYNEIATALWSQLKIPRIRVPWYDASKQVMYLHTMDVDNTDLKYREEIVGYDEDGEPIIASGEYHVVLQNAQAVGGGAVNVKDICTLISPFTVQPSVIITVDPDENTQTMICLGALRKINAQLNGIDGTELDQEYSFDLFLGSMTEYEAWGETYTKDLRDAIQAYRKENSVWGSFTKEDIEDWTTGSEKIKEGLIKLFEENLLRTGSKQFDVLIRSTDEEYVAIPYIVGGDTSGTTMYCLNVARVPLGAVESNVPEIYPGFPNVDYPTELTSTPIRLGLRHVKKDVSLDIPLREDIELGVTGDYMLIPQPENKAIVWYNPSTAGYETVAELKSLSAVQDGTNNKLSLTFAENTFAEGQTYDLLVPFTVGTDATTALGSACEGYAILTIKIVPEYLTWQGTTGAEVWYNDDNWHQSTEEELYMGGKEPGQDANGDDEITNAFAPLYFTKITIPNGEQLMLDEPKTGHVNSPILDFQNDKDTTKYIQYDMAVDTVTDASATDKITVVPYYINKVSEIYFKPEAMLMNQQRLNYQKAWVEFEMEKGKTYWLASPLKDVFAGDMYAPTGTGRQTTPAFADITYTDKTDAGNYDRWNPAFYQKAWDKGITYYTNTAGTASATVSAVQSNWSIEYNDVNVPYTLGKGFYASVEGDFTGDNGDGVALVRLPKADKSYSYYTKTADVSSIADRTYAGKLADGSDITVTLSDGDAAAVSLDPDGDGTHFLVGNPYMTYLDMKAFFEENTNLEKKFWTLDRAGTSVGTPDVTIWSDANGYHDHTDETTQSYVAPMTAFFVELNKDATTKTIKFTTAMMAAKPVDGTGTIYTKSYSASNPILTLTAERGETRSVARLLTSDKGHDAYEASEDAVLLLDSELDAPMVYTVAGDVAAQFNTLRSIKNVPLGVYADKGEEVELTIRGISQFAEKLYLYDAVTKQSTPLDDDSYTFRVTGPSHGRYILTSQKQISAEGDICVYSPTPGQLLVMSSPGEPLQRVQVYDISGRMVVSRDNIRNTTCQLTVPSGIYVVYAESGTGDVRVKIKVR